jgi:hypothetical protein
MVPVIGGRLALKHYYKEEAEAVCCDDGDGDVDNPLMQSLDHNTQQEQANCNLDHDGGEGVADFSNPPTLYQH